MKKIMFLFLIVILVLNSFNVFSVQYCKNITMSETQNLARTNEAVLFNLTDLNTSTISYELEIFNTNCNEVGVAIPYDNVTSTDTSVEIVFLANVSAGGNSIYSVIYGDHTVNGRDSSWQDYVQLGDTTLDAFHMNTSMGYGVYNKTSGGWNDYYTPDDNTSSILLVNQPQDIFGATNHFGFQLFGARATGVTSTIVYDGIYYSRITGTKGIDNLTIGTYPDHIDYTIDVDSRDIGQGSFIKTFSSTQDETYWSRTSTTALDTNINNPDGYYLQRTSLTIPKWYRIWAWDDSEDSNLGAKSRVLNTGGGVYDALFLCTDSAGTYCNQPEPFTTATYFKEQIVGDLNDLGNETAVKWKHALKKSLNVSSPILFTGVIPPSATINISSPNSSILQTDNPLNFTFSFGGFNATFCGLYINQTGTFTQFDNISAGEVNETIFFNQTSVFLNLTDVLNYFDFEENTSNITIDKSLYNNGTAFNSPVYVSSKGSNGTDNFSLRMGPPFDGYIVIPNQAYYNFGTTQDFSISAWIRSDHASDGTYHTIVDGRDTGGDGVFLAIASDDTIQLGINSIIFASVTTINDADWHHIVAVANRDNAGASDIWIDNVSQSVGQLTNTQNVNVATDLYIGRRAFSSGTFWEGDLDNIIIFNKSLIDTEISRLYDFGVQYNVITELNETTSINTTLNQSSNITLQALFPADIKSDYHKSYVNCLNDENVNSSFLYYNYSNDFTPPVLTYIYPDLLNSTYNYYVNYTFMLSEPATCSHSDESVLNDDFVITFSNSTYYVFQHRNDTGSETGSLNITCIDTSFNENSYTDYLTYSLDFLEPDILFLTPLNNTLFFNIDSNLHLVINFSDNHDLYDYNITIKNVKQNIWDIETTYYDNTSIISGTTYLFNQLIPTTSWANDTEYIINVSTCDSHTSKELKNLKNKDMIKTSKKIKFKNNKKLDVGVESIGSCKSKKTNSRFKKDRYSLEFDYGCNSKTKEYLVSVPSGQSIEYRQNSQYKGHFILNNAYWLDFEQDGNVYVTQIDNESYKVVVENANKHIEFNSIGELNCNTRSIFITRIDTLPETFLDFNLETGNVGSVLLFISLIILYLGLWSISFSFKNMAFGIFGFFIGVFIGLIIINFSVWLALVFILINIAIFFEFIRESK